MATHPLEITGLRPAGLLILALAMLACGGRAPAVDTTGSPTAAYARDELFQSMRQGGYVIYMRHTEATAGVDPDSSQVAGWWMSCDSAQARQLSPEGRRQAEALGYRLSLLALPLRGIYTSEFCRCRQTAELMGLPGLPVRGVRELTAKVYPQPDRLASVLDFAAGHGAADAVLLLVGHALPESDAWPALASGDALILQWRGDSPPEFVARLSPADWPTGPREDK